MKRFLLLFFIFLSLTSYGQLKDDFSDGDFTGNPAWAGDVTQFKINSSKQLQLSSSGAGTSSLSTANNLASLDNIEWHFWIHQGFSGSASNYERVYLVSDQSDLKGSLNGYYLQFGEALSNDAVELFRQSGTTSTSVCRGISGQIANSFAIGVQVTRDSTGLWSLSIDSIGGNNYVLEATGSDLVFTSSSYLGVVCSYTSSNATNFYFDDFYAGPIANNKVAPVKISQSDIVINEILAHIKTGGKEFVELYNRSQKSFDLSQLNFTKRDLTTGMLDAPISLASTSLLLQPGDYLVLTDDPVVVKSQYQTLNPNAFLQMNLPTLVDAEDDIVLIASDSTIIDEVHYSENWQFPLLNSFAGVSLERLNFDHFSQDSTNWHSASETVGFATPGYKNSESDMLSDNGNEISIDPEIFSPDNDGHNDVLNIHYNFADPGNVANVNIYDARGRLVRNLINNELLGNDGYFVWDGLTNEREKARIGMYIIYTEVYQLNGNVKSYKKTCVLGGKL